MISIRLLLSAIVALFGFFYGSSEAASPFKSGVKFPSNMNQKEMFEKIASSDGFFAALDQSGGSTPKALKSYGVPEDVSTTNGQGIKISLEIEKSQQEF